MSNAHPPPPPPPIAFTTSPTFQAFPHFRADLQSRIVEVDESDGNSFHLAPILRKYTSARLTVSSRSRVTAVEFSLLYDALGLLRSLQYDVLQFNRANACEPESSDMLPSELRYCCFRLNRQAAAFGVRLPRARSSAHAAPLVVPGLDDLVHFIESQFSSQIEAARTLIAGGVVDFASLCELFRPGADLLDRGLATGIYGVPTAMRCRACYVSRGKSLFGVVATFYAAMECVVAINGRFAVVECRLPISEFSGTQSVHDGIDHFTTLSTAMRQDLLTRGRHYSALGSAPCSFMEYSDGSFIPAPKGGLNGTRPAARARGCGRFMVDSHAALVRDVRPPPVYYCDILSGAGRALRARSRRRRRCRARRNEDRCAARQGGRRCLVIDIKRRVRQSRCSSVFL